MYQWVEAELQKNPVVMHEVLIKWQHQPIFLKQK